MRIIFITPDFPNSVSVAGSGVGTYIYQQTKSLDEKHVDSVVIVCGQIGEDNKVKDHIKVLYTKPVGNIHYYISKIPLLNKCTKLIFIVRQFEIGQAIQKKLFQLLRGTGIEDTLLEVPEGWGSFLFCKKNRILPYIINVHGSFSLYYRSLGIKEDVLDKIVRKANSIIMNGAFCVICPSRFVASYYEKLTIKNVRYFPQPIVLTGLGDEPKNNYKSLKDQVTVLSISALSKSKGIDIIRDVIISISKTEKNIHFIIVGADGDIKKAELNASFCENNVSNIELVGYVSSDQIVTWYEKCDIFVSASRSETFGRTIAEAMLCGKPVIATNSGAIPELLDYGRCGILVDSGNSDSFAQAIIELAKDAKLRNELGEKGRKKILNEFSPALSMSEYLNLYGSILD